MSKQPITLGGKVFASKGEAIKEIQSRINEAMIGNTTMDPIYHDLFLLNQQKTGLNRTGSGVYGFQVVYAQYNTRCLRVIRIDGSWEDFSWRVGIGLATPVPVLAAACREAVSNQIDEAKGLLGRYDLIVHHEIPFKKLIDDWLATLNHTPPIFHDANDDFFLIPDDEKSWADYHRKHAVLKLLTKEEHRMLHSKKANGNEGLA